MQSCGGGLRQTGSDKFNVYERKARFLEGNLGLLCIGRPAATDEFSLVAELSKVCVK